jgi:hypothetical protein
MSQPPHLFDTRLIQQHLSRRGAEGDFITELVLADLEDRVGTMIREFPRAMIIGPDQAALPETLRSASAEISFERYSAFDSHDGIPPGAGDNYNLIISLLQIQAVNDVPGYLARLRAKLVPDGLLIVAAIGGESLSELREAFMAADIEVTGGASARVAPMIQVRDAGALLQRAGLALPVADVETHVVRYDNPFALMAEIKALGASNPLIDRPKRFATRQLLTRAAEAYIARDSDPDGRIRATLEVIWLQGWVPHESQQKPLRPGSATTRLGDILTKATTANTDE